MKKDSYIYIAIFVLLISSFPLALGWLPGGAFVPRALLVAYSLVAYPFVLKSRPFLLLCLYYLYLIGAFFMAGKTVVFVGLAANFMEMGIPIIVATILIKQNVQRNYERMGSFILIMTVITMCTSLYVLTFIDPNAIRAMVGMMANGDSITPYLRMGVADYSTAAMVMAMPCIMIGILKNTNNHRTKVWSLIVIAISLYFMYKASVTTTFLICLFITFGAVFVNKNKSVRSNIRTIFPFLFLSLIILVPVAIELFSRFLTNDDITGRTSMIGEMWSGGSYDDTEDLGVRIGLYQMSLSAFFNHPIFGNASSMIGGHNYILDRLGQLGIVGTIIHFSFVVAQCKISYKIIPNRYKEYYLLMLLGVFVLALLKNLSGFDYWTFMFLYYPCLLVWGNKRTWQPRQQ